MSAVDTPEDVEASASGWELVSPETAAMLRRLHQRAVDAERERDEARQHANEGRQAEHDADKDRHAALATLNQLFREHTDMIKQRDTARADALRHRIQRCVG